MNQILFLSIKNNGKKSPKISRNVYILTLKTQNMEIYIIRIIMIIHHEREGSLYSQKKRLSQHINPCRGELSIHLD